MKSKFGALATTEVTPVQVKSLVTEAREGRWRCILERT